MSNVLTKTEPLTNALNKQVANCSVLYMKLHNYHWFVKGESFYTLHAQFELQYNEMALHMDVIAERILSIGGQPTSTLKDILTTASIKEATGSETTMQMVSQLITDFETMSKELTEAIKSAEAAEDQPTADLLIGIRASLEKHAWMYKSFKA